MTVVEHYAEFCGPTALGSALDLPPRAIAARLIVESKMDHDGGTDFDHIAVVLGVPAHRQQKWRPERAGVTAYPTVSMWLREHPVGSFVLYVPGHVIHAFDGEVVADSRSGGSLLQRVKWYWPVSWGPAE
jgi:hypothetical protein